ncbi:hypothetical protein AVEN_266490-1 [Araneus ventricosus]|uniref:DUF4817 domain-containing protein n=1 Tax=Araneus ventricosus TaxID=182803 RepID=A0A4Y2DZF9_ARAVE|nr:hypothetical protein AVEN_266490-1 [Araneus ventricosus]
MLSAECSYWRYLLDPCWDGRSIKHVLIGRKIIFTMPLEKKEPALLMKLFYQNGSNLSTALREYRLLKGLRKGSMSRQALKKITKFEETRELGVLLSCRHEKNPEQGSLKQTSRRKEGNGYKINRNIWQTKRTSLGEEFVFNRSTKRNETSAGSICAK